MNTLRRRGDAAGALTLIGLVSLSACRGEPYPEELIEVDAGAGCEYKTGIAQGSLDSASLAEVSGMAVSRKNLGILWVHNDSGDGTHVYAISSSGVLVGTFTLDGVTGTDVEDIGIGPGPTPGQDYLYLADIGDNEKARPEVYIYRFPEPTVAASDAPVASTLTGGNTFVLKYPNAEKYNSESLIVDPLSGDLTIVTKDQGFEDNEPGIYSMPAATPVGTPTTLTREGSLPLGDSVLPTATPYATGASISPDGLRIIVRTASEAFIWERGPGESVAAAMKRAACSAPVASEAQGEAIAFDENGDYLTVSEGLNATIYRYSR